MNLVELEDRSLVSMYMDGNEQAFEILLKRHKNQIYRYIYRKLQDTELTEDVFQEVFIKIINTLKRGKYNEEGKFLPWAMRIAHNLVIDHFRRNNKRRFISESTSKLDDFTIFDVLSTEDRNVEELITHRELVSQMIGLIDYLPKSQRDIIKMRIFGDMAFKDIAEKENVSINTALGRMRYALINLRKMIEENNIVTPATVPL